MSLTLVHLTLLVCSTQTAMDEYNNLQIFALYVVGASVRLVCNCQVLSAATSLLEASEQHALQAQAPAK